VSADVAYVTVEKDELALADRREGPRVEEGRDTVEEVHPLKESRILNWIRGGLAVITVRRYHLQLAGVIRKSYRVELDRVFLLEFDMFVIVIS
jgi:hypothetical protein